MTTPTPPEEGAHEETDVAAESETQAEAEDSAVSIDVAGADTAAEDTGSEGGDDG